MTEDEIREMLEEADKQYYDAQTYLKLLQGGWWTDENGNECYIKQKEDKVQIVYTNTNVIDYKPHGIEIGGQYFCSGSRVRH